MSGTTPHGRAQGLSVPALQDYPRLVFTAPYFEEVPLAELIEPSVQETVEGMLPSLVPPYVQDAANTAVANLAVQLTGSTMSGPLFLSPVMPTQPAQAASMAYVDSMIATAGVPEVPTVPAGQTWARQTGQWVPVDPAGGNFLPLTGGAMQGAINMGGNAITNLPAVPTLPNGAAPAQWVLNQIAASSLYQGTYNADTEQPDLTQPQFHQNGFTWIVITTQAGGVVVSPPIPGLQGLTIFNGDQIIYSAMAGAFQLIHAGGMSFAEAQATFVPFTGGTMNGILTLAQDPVGAMDAATRQWVLAQLSGSGIPDAPGDGQIYGRNGLTHSWLAVLALSGGILTGALTLAANATQPLHAVPLQQVQSLMGSYVPLIGGVTITGALTMTGLTSNLTLNSNASQPLQAVPLQQLTATLGSYAPLASPAFTGNPTAPTPATADSSTSIATTANVKANLAAYLLLAGGTLTGPVVAAADPTVPLGMATKAYVDTNVSATVKPTAPRNIFINGTFRVAQRPGTTWTTQTYTIDRWTIQLLTDTVSVTRPALADADRAAIGDERAMFCLQNVFTGSSSAGAYSRMSQPVEDVHALSGKTVTVSFWARCLAGTMTIPVGARQYFGSGGSPSAIVTVPAQNVAITTAWARYSVQIALPSVAGKTLGSNNNDCTIFDFYYSQQGNVVQAGTVQFWGFQCEIGSAASVLQVRELSAEWAACQRFFQPTAMYLGIFNTATGQAAGCSATFTTPMRGAPTLTVSFNGSSNFNPGAPGLQGTSGVFMAGSSQAGTNTTINYIINCDAEL